jgi:hypothetical protein
MSATAGFDRGEERRHEQELDQQREIARTQEQSQDRINGGEQSCQIKRESTDG